MNDEADQKRDGEFVAGEAKQEKRVVGTTRRRLLRGGAAAAPVILTFTSRPVLGFQQACVAPSRMISGNFSGFSGPISCGGNTRRSWYDQVNGVPGGQRPPWAKLLFATELVIPATAYVSISNPQEKTVGDILIDSYDGGDNNSASTRNTGFASYIISAYLNSVNAVNGVDEVLKPAQVIHMWNDIVGTSGQYCPQISMCWDVTGVIGYLQNSGIVPS